MRVIAFFICLVSTIAAPAGAETFVGHIQYDVQYNKDYIDGPLPREKRVDFYVKDHLKLIVVDTLFAKKKQVSGYFFDDSKEILTQINYSDKTFTPVPYKIVPSNEIVEDPMNKNNTQVVHNYTVKGRYMVDKKKNLHYEAWYSDLTTKPIGIDKFDAAHIVDKAKGKIALLLVREVVPGTKITYKASKIEHTNPTSILAVPKDFKISKQAAEK